MARKTPNQQEPSTDIANDVSASDTNSSNENLNTSAAALNTPVESTASHYTSACGGAIRTAREKQGMSVNDVANQLRLGIKQVEAIEADDFEKLPHPSIVRGFIRNYAKLLKIDAEPLLAGYYQLAPNAQPQSFRVKSNAGDTHVVIGEPKASFSMVTFIGMIALFALIGALFYYYTQNVKPNAATSSDTLNPPALEDQASEPATVEFALPAAERQAAPLEGSTELTLPPAANAPTANPLPNEPNAAPAGATSGTIMSPTGVPQTEVPQSALPPLPSPETSTPPPIVPVPNINPASIDSNKKALILEVNAKEETWINITDASGKQIYSKVVPGGSTDSIQAIPPVNVVVGNPAGTTLIKNGQPLDLAAHTRSKVARLTLND